MAAINLNQLTIPTPEPYSKNDPSRNQENVYFCLLQLLELAKAANFTIDDAHLSDLSGVIDAIESLQFNQERIDLGDVEISLTGKALTLSES